MQVLRCLQMTQVYEGGGVNNYLFIEKKYSNKIKKNNIFTSFLSIDNN